MTYKRATNKELRRRTIFWHQTGPQIDYTEDGVLHIADLNPEIETCWRMTRIEMIAAGLRFILAGAWRP